MDRKSSRFDIRNYITLLIFSFISISSFTFGIVSYNTQLDIRSNAQSCNYSDCEMWKCPGNQCDKCAVAPYYWWASGCPNLPSQTGCCTVCGDVNKIFRSGIDPQTKCITSIGYSAGNDGCYHPDSSVDCGEGNLTPSPTVGNNTMTPTPIVTIVPTFPSPTPDNTTPSIQIPTATPTAVPTPTIDPAAYQGRTEPCTNEAWKDIINKYNSNNSQFQEYMAFLRSCTNICRVPGPQICTFDPNTPPASKCPVAPAGNICAVDKLLAFFDNDIVKATNASRICFRESGGDPNALNRRCTYSKDGMDNDRDGCVDLSDTQGNNCSLPLYDGATVDYSIGLFQINLLPSSRCPGSFNDYTWDPPYCSINNQSTLDLCVKNFKNADYNIRFAYQLSQKGTNWSHWATAGEKHCNL